VNERSFGQAQHGEFCMGNARVDWSCVDGLQKPGVNASAQEKTSISANPTVIALFAGLSL
jgi:hypothetical protein